MDKKDFMKDILNKATTSTKEVYKEKEAPTEKKVAKAKKAGRKSKPVEEKAKPITVYFPPSTHEALKKFEEEFQLEAKDTIKIALNMLLGDLELLDIKETLQMRMIRSIIENGRD